MRRAGFVCGLLALFFVTSIGYTAHAWFLGNDKPKSTQSSKPTYINRDSTFDPTTKDAFGRTNVQRMDKGLAPIGKDGKPVQILQFQQKNQGKRVEITSTEQRKIRRYRPKPSQIDKGAFAKERRQHWKDRAKDYK